MPKLTHAVHPTSSWFETHGCSLRAGGAGGATSRYCLFCCSVAERRSCAGTRAGDTTGDIRQVDRLALVSCRRKFG